MNFWLLKPLNKLGIISSVINEFRMLITLIKPVSEVLKISLFHRHDDSRDALRTDQNGNQVQTQSRSFWVNLFGQHNKIEHWGLTIAILTGVTMMGLVWCGVVHHNRVIQRLETVNASGTQVKFSRTKSSFVLHKTVVSKDGKWAFIPFNFTNASALSNNANDYRVMIMARGNKHATLSYHPEIRMILFGPSGKGCIAIGSATKVQNQPITVFLINRKYLAAGLDSDNTGSQQTSYNFMHGSKTQSGLAALQKKYDFLTFSVNPAPTEALESKNRPDITFENKAELYDNLFGHKNVNHSRATIAKDWQQVKAKKALADQDRNKLIQMGYDVPEAPKWMDDNWEPFDTVNMKTKKTKNGHSALSYTTIDSDADKDNVTEPDTLKNKNGKTMGEQVNGKSQANQDSSSNNSDNTEGASDQDLWSTLTQTWDEVHQLKRDIFVTQRVNILQYNEEKNEQNSQTSIGKASWNRCLSKVQVRTIHVKAGKKQKTTTDVDQDQ